MTLFVLADAETFLAQVCTQDFDNFAADLWVRQQFFRQFHFQIGVENRAAVKRRSRTDADQSQVVERRDHRVDVVRFQFFGGFVEPGQFPGVAGFVFGEFNDIVPFVFVRVVDLRPAAAQAGDIEAGDLQQVGLGPVRELRRDVEPCADFVDFVLAEFANVAFVFVPFDFVAHDEVGKCGLFFRDRDSQSAAFGGGVLFVERINHAEAFVVGFATRRQRTAFQSDDRGRRL